MKIGILTFLFGCFFALSSFSQVNTFGKDFYVAFMENGRSLDSVNTAPEKALIMITAAEKTVGMIETPREVIPFELEKGQSISKEFEANAEGLIHPISGEIDQRKIHVTSTGLIAVHAMNGRAYSSDGTVVLPTPALGFDYMVFTHHEKVWVTGSTLNHTMLESAFVIVATDDDTEVEILTSVRTMNGLPANYRLVINLNAGETYQLKSQEDLSGTRIKVLNDAGSNCKKIAVFASNRMTSSGICGTTGDHLFQQAYPVKTWGKEFIHVPFKDRTAGEFVKILALEDDTEVWVNGLSKGKINAGKQMRLEFKKNDLTYITTSKPSSTAVLSKSGFCNEFFVASLGDPTFLVYSPLDQRIQEAFFTTGKLYGRFNVTISHLVNLLVPKGTATQTRLDGQSIGNQFKSVPGTDFDYAQIEVAEGAHTISNPEGLIGYVYASGQIESYSYSIGTNLDNIQYEASSTYDFEVIGDQVACLNEVGTWEIAPENPIYSIFSWDFGDGSSFEEGKIAGHTYEKPGKYIISVFASSGSGRCDEEERFQFQVEVFESKGILEGSASVCPELDEVNYFLKDTLNVHRTEWKVEGGELIEKDLLSAKVKWGTTNANASISVKLFTEQGCPSEWITFPVEITEQIAPGLPEGDSGICGGSSVLTYHVPFPSSNRIYTWTVVGGNIQSGQGSESIEVEWDLNAPTNQIFYTEESQLNAACFGKSPVLEVDIYPPMELNILLQENPSCPGESNGKIILDILGGSGKYRVNWNHDPQLNKFEATGLAQGTYEVEIEDETGCDLQLIQVELRDPEPLNFSGIIEVKEVSCFDGSDGEVVLNVTGGTLPYQVPDFESDHYPYGLQVKGLKAGVQTIFLQDSRGCILPISVEMPGASEITAQAIIENPGCEGSLDGVLELEISGGTPPYEITWSNGRSGQRIDQLPFGTYSYVIKDSNGCEVNGSTVVNQARPEVRMPTGFDPSQGAFGPVSNCTISYELLIWDRWGGLIYSGSDGWDGRIKGELAPQGSYSFQIKYEYRLEGEMTSSTQRGGFVLVR